MRVLKLLGTVPRNSLPPHLKKQGQIVEDWVAEMLGPGALRQFEITHPWGTGHADFLTPDGTLWEVKKVSIHAMSKVPLDAHLMQCQALLHFWFVEGGQKPPFRLVYVPWENFYQYKVFPVEYSPTWGAQVQWNMERLAEMAKAREVPPIPAGYSCDEFPCYYETQNYENICPFHYKCWAGRPDVPVLEDRLLAVRVEQWNRLKSCKKTVEADAKKIDDEIKEIQRELAPHFEKWGNVLHVGKFEAKRVPMHRETFDFKSAELAGLEREKWGSFLSVSDYFQHYLKGGK